MHKERPMHVKCTQTVRSGGRVDHSIFIYGVTGISKYGGGCISSINERTTLTWN